MTSLVASLTAACLSAPPSGSGTSPDGSCGTLGALSDDFEGLSDWRWSAEGLWNSENGKLLLTPSPATLSAVYSRVHLAVEGELVIELDTSGMAADSSLSVSLLDGEREVALRLAEGTLRADVSQPGFEGTRGSVAYHPEMRWWRISRADGVIHWATASDGTDWTDQGEIDTELSGLAQVAIEVWAESTDSIVAIGGINPDGPREPACPVDSFIDDFSVMTPRWTILDTEVCSVEFVDRLEISLNGPDACGLVSSERFSLENSQVAIELPQAGDCVDNPTFDVQFSTGGFSLACSAEEGPATLRAFFAKDDDFDELGSAEWDQQEFRFLQIRHAPENGGMVYETSANGVDWARLATASNLTGVDLSSVEVSLVIYGEGPSVAPVAFDQLNILPDSE